MTGDGQVTQADIDIIIANLGMSGPDVTRLDGDLNGDGVVDALDLAIAMDNLGAHLIDVTWDVDGVPTVLGGNGKELVVWRIPGGPPQGCLGDVGEGGLCCGCCGSPGFECRCCEDDEPGFGPCDTNPCGEECPLRWCNPDCDPGTPGAVQYGPCHPLCPGSECNPECEHFDPCNEECGDYGHGPCSANCGTAPCNPACGGNPCDPACAGSGFDCCEHDPCDEQCEGEGGGPCGENCETAVCNPACDFWNPCHPVCAQFGDGPCSEACEAIPFDPEDGMRMLLVEEQAVLLQASDADTVFMTGLLPDAAGATDFVVDRTIDAGQVIFEGIIENKGNGDALIFLENGAIPAIVSIGPGENVIVGRNTATWLPCNRKCLRGACSDGFLPDIWIDSRCYCECWACRQFNLDWLDELPDCPCSVVYLDDQGNPVLYNPDPAAWTEPKPASRYHPGARWCMRSKCPWIPGGPGQQCCYDWFGDLITATPAAGTPDIVAPCIGRYLFHYREDVVPYDHCNNAGWVNCYLKHRPPTNGNNCWCNPPNDASCTGEAQPDPCPGCD